jgi:hypothetical protein
VIDYLYGFALLPKSEQQTLVKEWIKYADTISNAYTRGDGRKRTAFLLPGSAYLICRDALCRVLGIGMDAWASIFTMAKNNIPPSHGLAGKAGNRLDDSLETLLEGYFTKLLTLAMPRATQIIRTLVRDQVITELKDDDEDIQELPSHMSKRSLYDQLLLQIGWKNTYDGKSRIVDQQPVEGVEQQQEKPPSWSSF